MQEKGFLKLLFDGFFSSYKTNIIGFFAIIGVIIAIIIVPTNITLNHTSLVILIIIEFTLIFMIFWSINRGFLFYNNMIQSNEDLIQLKESNGDKTTDTHVVDFLRSDNYGEEFVFLIESKQSINPGDVAELKRFSHGVEMSFALIEFMEKNSKGQYQATHIWFSPGHLRDLKLKNFSISEITVDFNVHSHTLKKYMGEIR